MTPGAPPVQYVTLAKFPELAESVVNVQIQRRFNGETYIFYRYLEDGKTWLRRFAIRAITRDRFENITRKIQRAGFAMYDGYTNRHKTQFRSFTRKEN